MPDSPIPGQGLVLGGMVAVIIGVLMLTDASRSAGDVGGYIAAGIATIVGGILLIVGTCVVLVRSRRKRGG